MSFSKRFGAAAVGILLIATPALALAQVSSITAGCSTAPTVACLQAEIQQLVQILNQFLAGRQQQYGQASATITSASTQSSGNVAVTGTLSNTDASSAIVVLVSQPYNGASDWNTIGGFLQG